MVSGAVVNKCGFGIRPNEERADAETAFIDNRAGGPGPAVRARPFGSGAAPPKRRRTDGPSAPVPAGGQVGEGGGGAPSGAGGHVPGA